MWTRWWVLSVSFKTKNTMELFHKLRYLSSADAVIETRIMEVTFRCRANKRNNRSWERSRNLSAHYPQISLSRYTRIPITCGSTIIFWIIMHHYKKVAIKPQSCNGAYVLAPKCKYFVATLNIQPYNRGGQKALSAQTSIKRRTNEYKSFEMFCENWKYFCINFQENWDAASRVSLYLSVQHYTTILNKLEDITKSLYVSHVIRWADVGTSDLETTLTSFSAWSRNCVGDLSVKSLLLLRSTNKDPVYSFKFNYVTSQKTCFSIKEATQISE